MIPSSHSREGGNPEIPWLLLDSGSPLRCGRNDVLNCRVNSYLKWIRSKDKTAI
jgi:hypothetical protein